jgi:hypothetical protein
VNKTDQFRWESTGLEVAILQDKLELGAREQKVAHSGNAIKQTVQLEQKSHNEYSKKALQAI